MTDYENVNPETLKVWKKEYRKKCRAEMHLYLRRFPDATQEEIQDLREWVESGHSPYENGDYIATESGESMDFINARRSLEELCQDYMAAPDRVSENVDSDDDLPF